jgi:hypothetical protein
MNIHSIDYRYPRVSDPNLAPHHVEPEIRISPQAKPLAALSLRLHILFQAVHGLLVVTGSPEKMCARGREHLVKVYEIYEEEIPLNHRSSYRCLSYINNDKIPLQVHRRHKNLLS